MRTGPQRPVRILSSVWRGVAAIVLATSAAVSPAAVQPVQGSAALYAASGQDISDFYRERGGRPLWFSEPGRPADVLIELLGSAQHDGLNPERYSVFALEGAVRAAEQSGSSRAMRRADLMLSRAFVDYVRDLRTAPETGMIHVDPELKPAAPGPRAILEAAAAAPSLEQYLAEMRWMNPLYGQLRHALATGAYDPKQRALIQVNLERARELPANSGRYVLVNAAAQRLSMYENREVVDTMRVVVGKPKNPTPMMSALIRFAALNPYWYVPPDLATERIAPHVVKGGLAYLMAKGYEVVPDFVGPPTILDPQAVDWKAVAAGTQNVYLRQLPGPGNAMGRMKFMFPNHQGIYLHDTPDKELLSEASRLFSGGCIRLEDAPRLGRWLFGRSLDPEGATTEQKVPLDRPVPVFITYLTVIPDGQALAFLDDIYGRDAARLAELEEGRTLAAVR